MSNNIKYLCLLSILFATLSWGQGFKMHFSNSFADCFGAVEVFDFNQPSRVQFPGNWGVRDDFIELDEDFHEVNSVWLRLEPRVEGSFEFVISTENNVDFSYYLFRANDNSFCEKLEADRVSSLLFQSTSYHTKGATDYGGEGFKGSVECKVDDIFYLMIHTNSTYKGHVTVQYKRIGKLERTRIVVQDFRRNKNGKFLRVRIRDKETGEPVEANMIINGVKRDNDLFMGTDFLFDATTEKEMHIESNTKGYFLFVKDFETKDARGQNMEILLELERLSPGKKLALQNIKFEQDSDDFLPIAYPALKRLLDFMALNSEIRIEIQGHVNAPGMENEGRIKSLSEKRAKAVKSFLKDNGIDGDRIEVRGYGNTKMIFPEPKSIKEEEANRRVEIKIID
ncbi:MAG: OmpA family protein [Crocinitomicaceae bacterium]